MRLNRVGHKVFAVGIGVMLWGGTAFAEVVTVTGMGLDRAGALNDAKRNAVEEIVGTYIDSRSLMEKSVVVLDEIYSKSQGFVKDIQILEERQSGDSYIIRAKIDVDTSPDSELIGRLKTVVALRDPRIAVFVKKYTGGGSQAEYPRLVETAINEKLISEGFSHIVDSGAVRDGSGRINLTSRAADYLVIGELALDTAEVMLPSYKGYTDENNSQRYETGIIRTLATLSAKIITTDTRKVIGEFSVTGEGAAGRDSAAEERATQNLSSKAAEEVRKILARAGASANASLEVIARVEKESDLSSLEKTLRSTPGVHGATLRGYSRGKGTFAVDTDFTPPQLFQRLIEGGKLKIFMETASSGRLEISVGDAPSRAPDEDDAPSFMDAPAEPTIMENPSDEGFIQNDEMMMEGSR